MFLWNIARRANLVGGAVVRGRICRVDAPLCFVCDVVVARPMCRDRPVAYGVDIPRGIVSLFAVTRSLTVPLARSGPFDPGVRFAFLPSAPCCMVC